MGGRAALSDPRAGDVVEGYRIEREIGRGGMGIVCAATELATGTRYALKFLRDDPERPLRRRRFLREAQAMMAVRHRHVVRIRAVHDVVPCPFIVMELVDGESLGARLRRGALSSGEAADVAASIAAAVGTAHAAGIIHRDLKPDNVLIATDRSVSVVDFGIAKIASSESGLSTGLTDTDEILGTPHYMSPEQIFGEDLDVRTDVWSLGVILFECLTGARPFQGGNVGQVLKAITSGLPPSSEALSLLPRGFADLISKMLSPERSDRPEDMRVVVRVLAPFGSHPVSEPPKPAGELIRRPLDGGDLHTRRAAVTLDESSEQRRPLPPQRMARRAKTWIFALSVVGFGAAMMMVGRWGRSPSTVATRDVAATGTASAPFSNDRIVQPSSSTKPPSAEERSASASNTGRLFSPLWAGSAASANPSSSARPLRALGAIPPARLPPAAASTPPPTEGPPTKLPHKLPGGVASEFPF